MQLNPRESFTIVRQIEDHTDLTTYYVQAIVRNAKTDALLATVNLTLKGDQRYSADYLVPVDGSGQGFWISIVTSVYTDAGYTTKSGNYGDKLDTYLVQERPNVNLGLGGGGGSDIDYKKVRKIIKEELDKLDTPEPKTIITERVVEIKVPEIIKVESTREIIKKIEVPKIIEKEREVIKEIEIESSVNLSGIEKNIEKLFSKIEDVETNIKNKSIVSIIQPTPIIKEDNRAKRLIS